MSRFDHAIFGRGAALRALLFSMTVVGAGACLPKEKVTLVTYPPPFIPIPPPRATIVPRSQFMEVAVLNFVDQTGRGGALVETLADRLSTAMHKSGRFEVYDRGQLRGYDATQVVDRCQKSQKGSCAISAERPNGKESDWDESPLVYVARAQRTIADFQKIREHTDAFVMCAITALYNSRADLDCRMVNSASFAVMSALSTSVGFSKQTSAITSDRSSIDKIAETFARALPRPQTQKRGKVLVQDGKVLTISLGRKDGIIAGLNVFVVGPGQLRKDGHAGNIDESHFAQAYVVAVYDNTSQVVVVYGTDYRVGDWVRFK